MTRDSKQPTPPELASVTFSAPACPPDCGHTVQEHTAFDHGLRDGEEGQADSANPYRAQDLREAWLTGHGVGVLNRRAESEAQNEQAHPTAAGVTGGAQKGL
jgi:ribosome modulation factor